MDFIKNHKFLVALSALLIIGGVSSYAAGTRNRKTLLERIKEAYQGYSINQIPESGDVYLLISIKDVVIIAKRENIFGKLEFEEIIRVPNATNIGNK